ncbi:MAG TPA: PQQ-binding-like beta-propeller repeat protein [Candidatus Aquilonibacter sp.]|nr:PQQ-binding-like beta-propeller repeat protein [Candidatus Aquilonibacter sp.]
MRPLSMSHPVLRVVTFTVAAILICATPAATSDGPPTEWTLAHFTRELNAVATGPVQPISWQFRMGAGTSATPTVSGSAVYVASNNDSVYALDLMSGRKLWEYQTGNMVMTAPLVYRGVVFAGQGNAEPIVWDPPSYAVIGSGINADYGISAKTGKMLWYRGVLGTAMPSAAIMDGVLIRHTGAGFVIARSVLNGALIWRTYVQSAAAMSAINIVNQTEIVTSGTQPNDVIALRPQDGKILWRHTFLPEGINALADCPVATDGTRIYGMYLAPRPPEVLSNGGPQQQHVYALDAKSGNELWNKVVETGVPPGRNQSAIPMVHAGVLYDGSSVAPYMHAFDAATGKLLWRTKVAGAVKPGIVFKDGIIYFGDMSGYLWALDASSGKIVGSKHMSDVFNVGSPIVVGSNLIIGGGHGMVFSVPLANIRAAQDAPPQ